MQAEHIFLDDMEQGSQEWLSLRKTKITATDAAVIVGESYRKTKLQLYHEKLSEENSSIKTERMQRGIDLEPVARELFTIQTGLEVKPKIVVKDWAMASLDGISEDGQVIVEIKCPGEKDHNQALLGKVPRHYYAQLQHQMYVCDLMKAFYYSFDGLDGVLVEVRRDDIYIEKMIEEEKKFYDCVMTRTPPEPLETNYVIHDDEEWADVASMWKEVHNTMQEMQHSMQELEKREEELRNDLIALSGQSNAKGAGISLCQIQRKGNVEYGKIPELKNVDLEKFRKPSISWWRICID